MEIDKFWEFLQHPRSNKLEDYMESVNAFYKKHGLKKKNFSGNERQRLFIIPKEYEKNWAYHPEFSEPWSIYVQRKEKENEQKLCLATGDKFCSNECEDDNCPKHCICGYGNKWPLQPLYHIELNIVVFFGSECIQKMKGIKNYDLACAVAKLDIKLVELERKKLEARKKYQEDNKEKQKQITELTKRNEMLEQSMQQVLKTNQELKEVNSSLLSKNKVLEKTNEKIEQENQELVKTNQDLTETNRALKSETSCYRCFQPLEEFQRKNGYKYCRNCYFTHIKRK